ncbi:Phage portal protein, lambda family [compost metagenome]
MNLFDKALRAVAPKMFADREISKAKASAAVAIRRQVDVMNYGYGDHGASRHKNSLKAWNPVGADADLDIHEPLERLRPRARDLFMGAALANGALKKQRTSIVGTGLVLKPTFDAEFLGLSEKEAEDLRKTIVREFSLWADKKHADADGMNDFYELQQLAFLSWLMSGECFALLPINKRRESLYDLRVKILEADRCPDGKTSMPTSEGNRIVAGVEIDETGNVVAYHFTKHHPGNIYYDQGITERVEVYGRTTGRVNVIHLMESERPEQRRGVPVLAPVIESLKQLQRYTEAELQAAVISSMFTVFITSETAELEDFQIGVPNPTGEPLPNMVEGDISIGNGVVNRLEPGEKVEIANPARQNASFEPFVQAVLRQVGSALEIPYEILINHFDASYSAARASLLEAWKMYRMRRTWLAKSFCQPIYEEWFVEAVTKGRINAPGIFDDPAIFAAYTKAAWHGPSQGQMDPTKEADAAAKRIALGLSTYESEAAEISGTDYEQNIRRLAAEKKLREKYGVPTAEESASKAAADSAAAAAQAAKDSAAEEDASDEDEQSNEGGENENEDSN